MIQIEKPNFKKIIMTIGNLPSSYVESLSYYECMLWLCNYLENTVIPAVNNNGEAVEELQSAYEQLQEFISDYFENLDVQEEINKKLDEMAEDGSLTQLIKGYVDPLYTAYETEINGIVSTQNLAISAQNSEIQNFKNTVNGQISAIRKDVTTAVSGSPKGVYATLAALQSADPDHDYIYLVTADGKWYYYSSSDTDWVAGGTYQSTGIGAGTVILSDLSNKIKNDIYKTVNTANLVWTNTSLYNGASNTSDNTLTSPFVYLLEGSTITFDDGITSRITRYDDGKVFISQSNDGYVSRASWTVPADGFYRIGIQNGDATISPLVATNTACSFTGYLLEEENYIKKLTFQLGSTTNKGVVVDSTTRIVSNMFYAEAGTVIKLKDYYPSADYRFAIDKYDLYGAYIGTIDWTNSDQTLDNTYLIRVRIYRQDRTIPEDLISVLTDVLLIKIKEIESPLYVNVNKLTKEIYKNSNIYDFSAHRGSCYIDIPENTKWSCIFANQQGFDRIEADVRFTSDGIPVLLHDGTINRTGRNSDGTEIGAETYIDQLTYAQVYEYDFGVFCGEKYAGTKIMTLDQLCKFAKYNNIKLNLDIKNPTSNKINIICGILKKWGLYEDKVRYTIPVSADITTAILNIMPKAEIALGSWDLSSTILNNMVTIINANPTANIIIDTYVDSMNSDLIEIVKTNNLKVNYFCENNADIIDSVNYGAYGMTVNNYVPYDYIQSQYTL